MGTIDGLRFKHQSAAKLNKSAKSKLNNIINTKINEQAKDILSSRQSEFQISNRNQLTWKSMPIALISKSANILLPKIQLLADDYLDVNNRNKLIKILAMAKSAIRHNMAKDLPKMKLPCLIIWGRNDNVTPPEVGIEFNNLLPNSDLSWIDKCGHAPMMEHPEKFNEILLDWLKAKFKK